jgi:hypothetical protein
MFCTLRQSNTKILFSSNTSALINNYFHSLKYVACFGLAFFRNIQYDLVNKKNSLTQSCGLQTNALFYCFHSNLLMFILELILAEMRSVWKEVQIGDICNA